MKKLKDYSYVKLGNTAVNNNILYDIFPNADKEKIKIAINILQKMHTCNLYYHSGVNFNSLFRIISHDPHIYSINLVPNSNGEYVLNFANHKLAALEQCTTKDGINRDLLYYYAALSAWEQKRENVTFKNFTKLNTGLISTCYNNLDFDVVNFYKYKVINNNIFKKKKMRESFANLTLKEYINIRSDFHTNMTLAYFNQLKGKSLSYYDKRNVIINRCARITKYKERIRNKLLYNIKFDYPHYEVSKRVEEMNDKNYVMIMSLMISCQSVLGLNKERTAQLIIEKLDNNEEDFLWFVEKLLTQSYSLVPTLECVDAILGDIELSKNTEWNLLLSLYGVRLNRQTRSTNYYTRLLKK